MIFKGNFFAFSPKIALVVAFFVAFVAIYHCMYSHFFLFAFLAGYFCSTKLLKKGIQRTKKRGNMRVKRNFNEMYDKLTPKNQKEFRTIVMDKMGWRATNSFYVVINGKRSISEPEEDYLLNLFAEFYSKQIQSVQL